ncbi:sodium-coupled monocarboxylate transporter 1-like protein 1 [Dinothrombium tinctorium]|uniref:Sodium-coupled monocarboxylate transporter 1-like protein 1 n=1 Tax=Dinothrombium tinctorium TaxID=1965070 RepID=A0A3S3QN60_9ACAR|nr:sodium-coupled monocarboxylate transporter 1-like protein 1 [Dinothrombium tinctorium]
MTSFSVIDCLVLIVMLAISIAISIYYGCTGRQVTNEDFLMGGRKMGVIPVAISLVASFVSPSTIMGLPSEVYFRGSMLIATVIGTISSAIITAELFLPLYHRAKLTSVNTIPWLAVILYIPAVMLKSLSDLSETWSILISGLIVTFYTSIGGLKAVVWTDVIQFAIIFAGLLAIIIKGTFEIGGVSTVLQRSIDGKRIDFSNFKFNPYMPNDFWSIALGSIVLFTGSSCTGQITIQRTCSLSTLAKAKKSLYCALIGFLIATFIYVYIGLLIFAYYYTCDPFVSSKISRVDEIVQFYIIDSMKNIKGLPGLFVASICSASLSSLSSGVNAIAAILWEDVISKFFEKATRKKSLLIIKLIAATVGLLITTVAFCVPLLGNILEAFFTLAGAAICPIFAVFLMGVLFPFVNTKGAIVSLISSAFVCSVINIGAIINKRPFIALQTSTDSCDDFNSTSDLTSLPFSALRNHTIPIYEPKGLNRLFHISQFMVPVLGFTLTVVIGVIVSILTGCNRSTKIDLKTVNPFAAKLFRLRSVKEKINERDSSEAEVIILSSKNCDKTGDENLKFLKV